MPVEDPITAAIEASVSAASSDEPAETVVEDASETSEVVEEEGVTAEVAEPVVEVDDFTKELEGLGLNARKVGERESRLPYSRVKKIVENARKKQIEAHNAVLKAEQDKYTKAEERLKNMDAVDRLILEPDRYIATLASLHPTLYKKFLEQPKPAAEVKPAVVQDPKPQPDWKYDDGTLGYSPDAQQKMFEWQARETERRVTENIRAEYDKRFGPIENNWKAQQIHNEKLPVVRAQIARAQKTWGEAFTKNEAEILKYMQENPEIPFGDCVSDVLVTKVQPNRDAMRADLLKEINARPKAAARSAPAAVVAAKEADGPRSMEDVIRESIKGLK